MKMERIYERLIYTPVNDLETITYWVVFLIPALLSLGGLKRAYENNLSSYSLKFDGFWWIAFLFLSFFIGLRHQVGGDWMHYLKNFYFLDSFSLGEFLSLQSDPGYQIISWLSYQAGTGIYGTNLICGLIFSFGLCYFCRSLPRPILALTVAIPYLVIVVAMGYSRQGAALGMVLVALTVLGRGKYIGFICAVIIGATLHKSAIILLPIAALAATKNRIFIFFWIMIFGAISYGLFLEDAAENYYKSYLKDIQPENTSDGAYIRTIMNIIPAAILLFFRNKCQLPPQEKQLWMIFSVLAVMSMIVLIITSATTAVDRIGLYILPLQLFVFSYLPDIFGNHGSLSQWIRLGIIIYYSMIMFVWLNYATYAHFWLPYDNVLIPTAYFFGLGTF